jgi:hypothetical protein
MTWSVWGARVIAAGSVVVLGAAGAAAATARTPSHGYLACAKANRLLELRDGKRCPRGARTVAIGARGDRGPAGARGPSDVYFADAVTNPTSNIVTGPMPASDGTFTEMLSVPAGSYLIHLEIETDINHPTVDFQSYCEPLYVSSVDPGGLFGEDLYAQVYPASDDVRADASLDEAQTFSVPTKIEVGCIGGTVGVRFDRVEAMATRVANLHATGYTPLT